MHIHLENFSPESVEQRCRESLKLSWLGRGYRYCSALPATTRIAQTCWHYGLSTYLRILYRRRAISTLAKTYPLVKLSQHAPHHAQSVLTLAEGEASSVPAPSCVHVRDTCLIGDPPSVSEFPPVTSVCIHKAFVLGGSNFILHRNKSVIHDLYDFTVEYTAEEEANLAQICSTQETVTYTFDETYYQTIPEAATFLDALSFNYCHWLTAVLPRIAMFCEYHPNKHLPFLLDADLHPNIYESLRLVCGPQRRIILVKKGQVARIDRLHVVSCCGYIAFNERRGAASSGAGGSFGLDVSQGAVHRFALQTMRRRILEHFDTTSSAPRKEKIFLRRNSQIRQIRNSVEVERALESAGFTVVDPALLSFSEQVELVSRAAVLVSPSGASCANVLFCSKSTQFLLCIPRNEGTPYYYFQNIAHAVDIPLRYVFGDPVKSIGSGMHSDYVIDPKDILRTI